MGAISKELLSMMYNRVSELQFDNKVTYWCADGKNAIYLYFIIKTQMKLCNMKICVSIQHVKI